jgi:hypothetical protein
VRGGVDSWVGALENSSSGGGNGVSRSRRRYDSLVGAMEASYAGGGGGKAAILVGETEVRFVIGYAFILYCTQRLNDFPFDSYELFVSPC